MPKPAAKPVRKPIAPVRSASSQPEVVDPRWLLRMLGLLIVVALFCGYLTLGLLFYLGSWQLALKPTHDPARGSGLQSEKISFGDGKQGKAPVSGEWLAAGAGASGNTVLYLRGADGQLDAGDGTQIGVLHDHGLNVLAFDYRGYGDNLPQPHPTEERMLQDAETAWNYLTQARRIAPNRLLVFGSGVGVSLAAQLLQEHKGGAALIGYNADPEVAARVGRDPRSKLFPMGLVFHERFRLDALRSLTLPKLLYSTGPLDTKRREVYRDAADPKLTVEVPTHNAKEEQDALSRFLDLYLSQGTQAVPVLPIRP
ncbi:MAG: alpha/beta hydrolase [Janthinobacterium lividum]